MVRIVFPAISTKAPRMDNELMLEVPEADLSAVLEAVRAEMESAYRLAVPLVTDAKVGRNWDEWRGERGKTRSNVWGHIKKAGGEKCH